MTSYYSVNTNPSVTQNPSRSMYNDTDNPFLLSPPPPVASSAGPPAPVPSSYSVTNTNDGNPYNNMNMNMNMSASASVSSGNPYGSNTSTMPNNMYGYQQPPPPQQQAYYNYGQPTPAPAQGYQQPPFPPMTNHTNIQNQAMVVSAAPNQPSNQWSLPNASSVVAPPPLTSTTSPAPPATPTATYSSPVNAQKPFDPMTSSYDPFLFTNTPKMPTTPVAAPPPAPTPIQHQPVATTSPTVVVSNINDDDDDIFGVFSVKAQQSSPPPNNHHRSNFNRPEEIEYDGRDDNLSVLSKSTGGTDHRNKYNSNSSINGTDNNLNSPLDDPKFAPKPPPVRGMENARTLARNAPPGASPLPNYELVTHSGYILSRISFRTILIKKWKQTFWVSYGQSKILFFRSSQDYEDWISNPYLTQAQRDFLVKASVDFVEDLYKPNVRGYQVTTSRLKAYQNQLLNQYKLERWMDYGPTIAAAFASPNEKDVFNLRTIMSEMMKRSPQDSAVRSIGSQPQRNATSNPYASFNNRPNHPITSTKYDPTSPTSHDGDGGGGASITNHNSWGYNGVSSAASTGMLDEVRSTNSGRTMRSYGVVSTGPMERVRDPVRESVGHYYSR